MHSPREHFHTYLQSLDVDRGGLPEHVPRPGWPRVLAHYGVDRARRAPPSWRRRSSGSSWPSSAPPPTSSLVTTLLQRWIADEAPEPASSPTRSRAGPRPAGAGHPAALPGRRRPGPQRPVPLVRPAAGGRPSASTCSPGVRDELADLAASPDVPDRAARIDALAAIPEQIVRFLAERLEQAASPSASRCSRCWPGGTTASTTCTTCAPSTVGRRPFVVCRLHPRRPADPPGHDRRHRRRAGRPAGAGRPGRARGRAGRRPRRRVTRPSSTSTWPGRRRRSRRTRPRPGWPSCWSRVPFAKRVRRVAVAVCPGGDRPVAYFSFRPGPDGGRRGRPGPRRAPDGRPPAEPVAAAQLPITRLDAPEDVLLYDCVAEDNQADQRLVALAQVRQLAVVRDAGRRGRLAAARRAGGGELPGGDPPGPHRTGARRRPARHEPRVGAHLAGGRRPARRAHRRCSARSRR